MRILLTNDDGVHAKGLWAMKAALDPLGDVDIVAPLTEQSGVSQQITYLNPLFCERWEQDTSVWVVDGTPSDCVKLGISELLQVKPDLVISGINSGLNTGINTHYSGTVAAAMEAALFGINAMAISLERASSFDYEAAARISIDCIERFISSDPASRRLLNVNIPNAATPEDAHIKLTYMKTSRHVDRYLKREDPKNRTYYWSTDKPPAEAGQSASDVDAVNAGFVSVTPLTIDRTHHADLQAMSSG